MRSCNFDKSQCCQLWMGYDYEIGHQVHLLEKNTLDTSCQLLVTWVCVFISVHRKGFSWLNRTMDVLPEPPSAGQNHQESAKCTNTRLTRLERCLVLIFYDIE